jgi:NTE family protein
MNAVVLADGLADGGPDKARAQLERFWRKASLDGGLPDAGPPVFDTISRPLVGRRTIPGWFDAFTRTPAPMISTR